MVVAVVVGGERQLVANTASHSGEGTSVGTRSSMTIQPARPLVCFRDKEDMDRMGATGQALKIGKLKTSDRYTRKCSINADFRFFI